MAVVQLTSESHSQKVLDSLYQLRLQGHLSDITVQVDYQGQSKAFQAHRVVLAASSGYFSNIFLSQDGIPDQIPLSNMLPCDFFDFLEFVYTGKVELVQTRIADVHAAAKLLDCKELARVCIENDVFGSDVVVESSIETETGTERSSKRSKRKTSKVKLSLGGRRVLQKCFQTEGEAFNAEEDDANECSPISSDFDEETLSPLLCSASEDEEGTISKRSSKGKFSCNDCQRIFQYEKSYLKHKSTRHGIQADLLYRCKTCEKTFSNRSNLRIHEKHVHSNERLFTCEVCNKNFKRKKDVVRHHKQVHETHLHECSECGKLLSSKGSLVLHKRTHSGIKAYVCSECGARFTQKSALNMHHRIHTGEKPYACDECDSRFTQKSMLAYHKRSHTGEKPFMCEACGKSFASKEYLRYHANIHTGSKPFKCDQCGRGFAQRNSLRQHMNVHTGARPYGCKFCEKHFTQLNALQRHQRIHTGEKPYMCGLCHRTFTDQSTLRRHTTTHDANAPWKNYLVVLQDNVEEKKSKEERKAAAQERKRVAQKARKSNAATAALGLDAKQVTLPPEWVGPGGITLVGHGNVGGITLIQTENLPEGQAETEDDGGTVTLDGHFAVPGEANPSEITRSLPTDTPAVSSLLEQAVSQTILAPEGVTEQPDILTVVVSEKMCKEEQLKQKMIEKIGDKQNTNP
ncbi:GDNF-inducible zinc finger protein 1 [Corythoichthys intestinalis]|uniref:GDNF-inducible zinc finger protein 1 n=1 Tax=Corythoichthys intestinalis TaxID=161448 RepID=UPI0025A4F560|nr:GDNF-inducible zinc finger protein 1 [Corythoichthys intestinalis]XP_061806445.1 GDNF-inducible zinc finger protein 1-like [Nerophis lumbriciformis]